MKHQFRYLADYAIGQKGETFTRTVTEADIVNFACLSADFMPPHVDRHFMAESVYGCRVAHGLLGTSLVTGLLSLSAPHIVGRGTPGAYFHGVDINYRDAIKLGDTIHVHWQVAEKASDPAHPDFGLVKTAIQVVTQEGSPVYDGTLSTLVREKSASDSRLQLSPGVPWEAEEFTPQADQVFYAEDYPIGKGGETEGRTITETDVVNFAGLTGDYAPQYVDAEFAKESGFGGRIAHGMLVFSCAIGHWTGHYRNYRRPKSKRPIAGHLNDHIAFLAPVAIGDTIRCRYKTAATKVSRSKPEMGLVTHAYQIVNQRNEVVQEGSSLMMAASRAQLQVQDA
jgi:acyl dehydratase